MYVKTAVKADKGGNKCVRGYLSDISGEREDFHIPMIELVKFIQFIPGDKYFGRQG